MELKDIISNELKKYNWGEDWIIENNIEDIYLVFFSKTVICFSYNDFYKTVECSISDINFKQKEIDISDVFKFNKLIFKYPDKLFGLIRSASPPEEYIKFYVELIYNNILKVIKGDFNWRIKYNEFVQNRNIIQEILDTPFIFNHPIYTKLENNDPTWHEDLLKIKNSK